MPSRRPLHPIVNEVLTTGLKIGARAAARAFDSLLHDAAKGLGFAEENVDKTRRNLRRKVEASGVSMKEPPPPRPRGSAADDDWED